MDRGRRNDLIRTGIGVLLLILVGLATIIFRQQSVAYRRVTECQAAYNIAVAEALAQRAQVQEGDLAATLAANEAQRVLLRREVDPAYAGVSRPEAVARYLATLDDRDRSLIAVRDIRRQHPLPQPPRC